MSISLDTAAIGGHAVTVRSTLLGDVCAAVYREKQAECLGLDPELVDAHDGPRWSPSLHTIFSTNLTNRSVFWEFDNEVG